jgi:hypothetical protein
MDEPRDTHVHVYRLTPLRKEEVPPSPWYNVGDKHFMCIDCGRFEWGDMWAEKKRITRKIEA